MTATELRALPYLEYLETDHWRTMRRLALEASDGHCVLCDTTETLDVHHRTYERRGAEQLRDLVVLCHTCHGRHHGVFEVALRESDALRRVEELKQELAAEMRGAAFLAAQVGKAWDDGVAAGRALARKAALGVGPPAADVEGVTEEDLQLVVSTCR